MVEGNTSDDALKEPWNPRFAELSRELFSVLGAVTDNLPVGLYILEQHTDRVLFANRRFCELWGLKAHEDAIRRGELTHSEVMRHADGGGAAPSLVWEWPAPEGAALPEPREDEVSLASGRTLRRLSSAMQDRQSGAISRLFVFEDVTERKRREVAVLRSEQTFRQLIERSPDGIFVHRERRFVYVNAALLTALGYAHQRELLGRSIFDIVHPDDLPVVRDRVDTVIIQGKSVPLREIRYLRGDGTWYYAESAGMPVEFDGAEAVVVMARDITERKQMQARLLQSDRMALVGTLAASVGHEINNPLTYVMANLNLALENSRGPGGSREQEEILLEAQEGATRVRNIVRDLKSFSRQDAEQRTLVDVREPLEFSIKMASSELRHRTQLVKEYEPVPPVYADPSRLGQVFLNLLVNAAQAITEGNVAANQICIRVRPADRGRVAVEVSDTGTGIPPELLARIFDPFFTTKQPGSGTGLGLSVCHGIIQGLGGELTVRSEVGKGSTFTVLLPTAKPEQATVQRLAASAPDPRSGARILIIDDEPAVGRSLARLIGKRHQVTVMTSGAEALARLIAGESYDVIFCDLMMPDATGMDIYERMRERRPDIAARIVFITGGAFTPRARKFLETVPHRWLEKPFDVQPLQELLGRVLGTAADVVPRR
ncbi:PAS domain S-box protein [Myxococcaceae bacterium GXIMD 01537]